MENHMGESVFLDELVKGPVDDLTFHRASVTGAEHKIVVDDQKPTGVLQPDIKPSNANSSHSKSKVAC